MIFDLLWLDGNLTTDSLYRERWRVLEALELRSTRWRPRPRRGRTARARLDDEPLGPGLEGIVAKRVDSKYELDAGPPRGAMRKYYLLIRSS